MQFYSLQDEQFILRIKVQPGAKNTEVIGVHGGYLKIRIKAPPIEGRANDALVQWLAELFDIPRRAIHITHGFKSSNKTVLIEHCKMDMVTLSQKLNITF